MIYMPPNSIKIKNIAMNIFTTFSKYQLNQGQEDCLRHLDAFLNGYDDCFLLKGYAGTGKTFLMKGMTEYLTSIDRQFYIAAPTGRAAKVISKKTNKPAYTIHKTIYSNDDIKEYSIVDEEGGQTFKFFYGLRLNQDQPNAIFIIDESSMISDVYSEGEFFRFGSGHLLKDLMNYVGFSSNLNRKVIFIGDNAQLPPYNCNFSPALSSEYLIEKFNIKVKEFELTEVVRQEKDSGILENATAIRESIKANNFGKLVVNTNYQDIVDTLPSELETKYFSVCNSPQDDDTIIITYSNKNVKEYNTFVRDRFFPNEPHITVGDKVIFVANNYNQPIEILNGDFGIIKEVSPHSYSRKIPLKKKKGDTVFTIDITLTFREVCIILKDTNDVSHELKCCIIENLLYSGERDLSSDQTKALYVDFKIRNSSLKAGSAELKNALRMDKYFNAIRVKFGYAITCHKSQGGEWKNAFVNFKTSIGYSNSSYFRWAYTALTRAKHTLYPINTPNYGLLHHLGNTTEIIYKEREDIIILEKEVLEFQIPFALPSEKPFLINIFYAVWELIKDKKINLDKIANHSYCEHYHFSNEIQRAFFFIDYNKDNKVTNVRLASSKNEFAAYVQLQIQKLANKHIILAIEEELNNDNEQKQVFDFPDDKPFLKEFYEAIKAKVSIENIVIDEIQHNLYHEIYKFSKNGLVAFYKFHYRNNGRFTTKELIPQKTTGLINELNNLLNT